MATRTCVNCGRDFWGSIDEKECKSPLCEEMFGGNLVGEGYKSSYTAVGIFQAGTEFNIRVEVPGFLSVDEANAYADSFRILLNEGRLFRYLESPASFIQLSDKDVSLMRIKPVVRERIIQAHRNYAAKGLNHIDTAKQSLFDFSATGKNDLVVEDSDFDVVDLPIAKWHEVAELTGGFSSLGCAVK